MCNPSPSWGLLRQLISTVVKNALKRLRKSPLCFAPLIHILPYWESLMGDTTQNNKGQLYYSQCTTPHDVKRCQSEVFPLRQPFLNMIVMALIFQFRTLSDAQSPNNGAQLPTSGPPPLYNAIITLFSYKAPLLFFCMYTHTHAERGK